MSRNEREEVETTFFPQIFICTVSRRHKRMCCFQRTKNNGSSEKTGRSKTRETTQDYNGPVRQAESKHHDKSYETHYRFEVEK